jgi:hypothetical protein
VGRRGGAILHSHFYLNAVPFEVQKVEPIFTGPKTLAQAQAMPSIHHWAAFPHRTGIAIDCTSVYFPMRGVHWPVTSSQGRYVVDFGVTYSDGNGMSIRGRFDTSESANLAALHYLNALNVKKKRARQIVSTRLHINDMGEILNDPIRDKLYPPAQTAGNIHLN